MRQMTALRLPSHVFHCFVVSTSAERSVPAASHFLLWYHLFLVTTRLALVLKQVTKEALVTYHELYCKVDGCSSSN